MRIHPGAAISAREETGRPPIPPMAGIAVGMLAFSTSAIITRYAQVYAPSLVIAAYRLALASLILAPIVLLRYGRTLRNLDRGELLLALASGGFLAIHFGTWITSLEYTTVASSLVLVWTSPLFVALLSPFTLGEPISTPVRFGLAVALTGSVIVGISDACTWRAGLSCPSVDHIFQGRAAFGDLLALAGAVAGAGYIILGRRLRRTMALVPYISLAYGAAAVVLIVAVGLLGQPAFGYPAKAYGLFALLALLPQLIAHSTYNWALRYLSAAYVSVALLGEPVGSTILAYFLLGEHPAGMMLVGGGLILTGIALASRRQADQIGLVGPPPEPG